MMSDLKWLTIEQRHNLHTSVMVYKVMNSLAPNHLCKYFTELSDRNITRGKTRVLLEIPTKRLACGQRTFQYRGIKLWNDIPRHVHETCSLDSFSRLLCYCCLIFNGQLKHDYVLNNYISVIYVPDFHVI